MSPDYFALGVELAVSGTLWSVWQLKPCTWGKNKWLFPASAALLSE